MGTITTSFFSELSQLLDHLATFSIPLLVTGDFNFYIERRDDPHTSKLLDLLTCYGLQCQVNSATHDLGGTLDVLFSCADLPSIPVTVSDPGLSDHRLLTWSLPGAKPPPVYTTLTYRPWRRIDALEVRALLSNSALCQPESWSDYNVDQLADLFDSSVNAIVDSLAPLRTATLRRRPSDPWFDDGCRQFKRVVRGLERRLQKLRGCHLPGGSSVLLTEASLLWRYMIRSYRSLLKEKQKRF